MKNIPILIRKFSAVLTALAVAGAAAAQETVSLNGDWDFALQKPDAPVPAEYTDRIPVPSCWAVLGFEEPVYRGFKDDKASTGHYRKTFTLPDTWREKRVLLHFDGVWECASPVLNGHELGTHDSGYTSFAYDVTSFLNEGSNVLEVKVEQTGRYYKYDVNDDWSMGGIYRDVWLESMPRKHWLEEPEVITRFDRKYRSATLEISTILCDSDKSKIPGNFPSPGEPCEVVYTLSDMDGRVVIKDTDAFRLQDATDRQLKKTFTLKNPVKWNAEHPYLYNLKVKLVEAGEVTHSRSLHVGMRQVEVRDGVFLVNGTPVKLRGVNRHDEHPDVGRATRREHWLQDLRMMKENNINYIRLCHYTPAKGFIDLCDSLGMYVSNEISLGGGDSHFRDPSYAEGALLRTYETVIRDINAPSIVFWTLGNEDPFTKIHLAAGKTIKALDPTRPIALPWRADEWTPEEFEILAPHYWQPVHYDSLATKSSRPIVTTEYTHAYGASATGGLQARWRALTRHAAGTGGAVWMWQDQGIRTPVYPEKPGNLSDDPYLRLDGQGWDGIVDSDRNPTRDLEEVKAVYAPVYPLTDRVKAGRKVCIPIRNDFDFSDLSEIMIVWRQFADGEQKAGGEMMLHSPAHSTKNLKLRLQPASGEYANYVTLTFIRADGSELAHNSIKLMTKHTTGTSNFPEGVDAGTLINSLKPTIWHRLDDTESAMYSKDERSILKDLNPGRYEAKQLSSIETLEDGVRVVKEKILYTIDASNSFTGEFEYRISDYAVKVKYSLTPDIQLSWIPVYGMTLHLDGLKSVRWTGPGPQDAYPNKRSAPTYGIWNYSDGIKATESILCTLDDGTLRIESDGYMEMTEDGDLNILGSVVSRPEKGRKAIAPFPMHWTESETPYEGEFTITYSK